LGSCRVQSAALATLTAAGGVFLRLRPALPHWHCGSPGKRPRGRVSMPVCTPAGPPPWAPGMPGPISHGPPRPRPGAAAEAQASCPLGRKEGPTSKIVVEGRRGLWPAGGAADLTCPHCTLCECARPQVPFDRVRTQRRELHWHPGRCSVFLGCPCASERRPATCSCQGGPLAGHGEHGAPITP